MKMRLRPLTSLALLGWMTVATLAGAPARAADRPADQILDEIRSIEMPQIAPADRNNQQAIQSFLTKRQAALQRKTGLIGELYQQHPTNPELVQLLPERWQVLIATPRRPTRPRARSSR